MVGPQSTPFVSESTVSCLLMVGKKKKKSALLKHAANSKMCLHRSRIYPVVSLSIFAGQPRLSSLRLLVTLASHIPTFHPLKIFVFPRYN